MNLLKSTILFLLFFHGGKIFSQDSLCAFSQVENLRFIPVSEMKEKDFKGRVYPCISTSDSLLVIPVRMPFYEKGSYRSYKHAEDSCCLWIHGEYMELSFVIPQKSRNPLNQFIYSAWNSIDSSHYSSDYFKLDSLTTDSVFFTIRHFRRNWACDNGWQVHLWKYPMGRRYCHGYDEKIRASMPRRYFKGVFVND